MEVLIEKISLEQTIDLLNLIKSIYKWKNPKLKQGYHPICIKKGNFAISQDCQGQKGNAHQIVKGVIIEIRADISKKDLKQFERILFEHGLKFQVAKRGQGGKK